MFTNRQILASVIAYWMKPMVESGVIGNMIKSLIPQTSKFSIGGALITSLAPLLGDSATALIDGALGKALEMIPDESVPQFAHDFVESAISRGGIEMFGIEIEKEDLEELAYLLDKNLPIVNNNRYKVISDEADRDTHQGIGVGNS